MKAILAALGLMTLSACASVEKLDAANDVHALLISIRDNDRAAFESHIDRPALKRVIQQRLEVEGVRDKRLGDLAAVFAPGLAEFAGEALIQPATFKLVADRYGYTPQTKIPGAVAISQALRTEADGRVCATRTKDGPCVLIFTKAADGHWKLSDFQGSISDLRAGR